MTAEDCILELTSLQSTNFPNVNAALEFILNKHVEKNFLNVSIRIENSHLQFDDFTARELLDKFGNNKKMLIAFESTLDNNFAVYWKNSKVRGLFRLELNDEKLETGGKELNAFVYKFLMKNLESDYSGVELDANPSEVLTTARITTLIDSRGYNLLMLAAEVGDLDLVSSLLEFSFYVNFKADNVGNAANVAWKNKHYNVLLKLLKNNFQYPEDFNPKSTNLPEELSKFLESNENFFEHLKKNKHEEVKKFLVEHEHLKYIYNFSNNSARSVALKLKTLEMYDILLANHVEFAPHEEFEELTKILTEDEKIKLRRIHTRNKQEIHDKHIMTMIKNTYAGNDEPRSNNNLSYLANAYIFINLIPSASILLKILAAFQNFQIIVDFKRESTIFIDPTTDTSTYGIFHMSNEIYIGALQLLYPGEEQEVYGTMGHEICHNVMNIVYRNFARPYDKKDKKSRLKFEEICSECEKKKKKEELIEWVFSYPKSQRHAELIVRIPHMLLRYANDPEKIEKLRETYKSLFDYYEEKVMKDLEKALPKIAKMASERAKMAERRLRRQRIIFLCILIVSLITIGVMIIFLMPARVYKWNDLSKTEVEKVEDSTINFQGQNVKFLNLVGNNSNAKNSLTSPQIKALLNGKAVNVSHQVKTTTPIYIERSFNLKFDELQDIDFNQFVSILAKNRTVILGDIAGSGKTITCENLGVRLNDEFKLHWISYFDLKKYSKIFKNHEVETRWNESSVVEFISTELLNLDDNFELAIFSEKFTSGNAILIWDGFDELNEVNLKFTMNLFSWIRENTRNIQIIATRPLFIEDLMEGLSLDNTFTLKPYTEQDRVEYLTRFFKLHNYTDVEIKAKIKIFHKTILVLEEKQDFNVPLVIRMFGELQLATNSSLQLDNKYTLYNEFISKTVNSVFEKGDAVLEVSKKFVKLRRTNLMTIFQHFAIKMLYQDTLPGFLIRGLNIWNMKIESKNISFEDISRYGIMNIESENNYNFVHRTFAEYFVAQYLIDNLINDPNAPPRDDELRNRFILLLANSIMNTVTYDILVDFFKLDVVLERHPDYDKASMEVYEVSLIQKGIYCISHYHDIYNSLELLSQMVKGNENVLTVLYRINGTNNIYDYLADIFVTDRFKYEKYLNLARKFLPNYFTQDIMSGILASSDGENKKLDCTVELLSDKQAKIYMGNDLIFNITRTDYLEKSQISLEELIGLISSKDFQDAFKFIKLLIESVFQTINEKDSAKVALDTFKIFVGKFKEILKNFAFGRDLLMAPFYNAALNKNPSILRAVIEFNSEHYDQQVILSYFDEINGNFLFEVIEKSTVQTTNELVRFLEDTYRNTPSKLLKFLRKSNSRGKVLESERKTKRNGLKLELLKKLIKDTDEKVKAGFVEHVDDGKDNLKGLGNLLQDILGKLVKH